MAENIIKDFVKKQTTPISIGVPKQRPVNPEPQKPVETYEAKAAEPQVQEQYSAPVQAVPAPVAKNRPGRPKGDIEKVKLSLYVPQEAKDKLIRIQHQHMKSSLNDVLIEAIYDLLKKYER